MAGPVLPPFAGPDGWPMPHRGFLHCQQRSAVLSARRWRWRPGQQECHPPHGPLARRRPCTPPPRPETGGVKGGHSDVEALWRGRKRGQTSTRSLIKVIAVTYYAKLTAETRPFYYGHLTSGGMLIRMASVLPPVLSPNSVPRSCRRLNST